MDQQQARYSRAELMSVKELIKTILLSDNPHPCYRIALKARIKLRDRLIFCCRFNLNRRTNPLTILITFDGPFSDDKVGFVLPQPWVFSDN